MEVIAGYLASGLIGISLGLLGGGGSIITIPVLVYLFNIEPVLATAYSLFVVGATSAVGAVKSAMNKNVDFKNAVVFAIPSTIAIFLTRHFLLPWIPEVIFQLDGGYLSKDMAIMILLSVVMVAAGIRMIQYCRYCEEHGDPDASSDKNYLLVLGQGLIVGLISGIVGAGGGFLIIPALVLLVKLPMKQAIGTSLLIIAINSLIGFLGDTHLYNQIDFGFLITITGLAFVGVFVGIFLAKFVRSEKLKTSFGWFTLVIAAYIGVKEVILIL